MIVPPPVIVAFAELAFVPPTLARIRFGVAVLVSRLIVQVFEPDTLTDEVDVHLTMPSLAAGLLCSTKTSSVAELISPLVLNPTRLNARRAGEGPCLQRHRYMGCFRLWCRL